MLVPNKALLFHLFWFYCPFSLVLGTELCWDVKKKKNQAEVLFSLSESAGYQGDRHLRHSSLEGQ